MRKFLFLIPAVLLFSCNESEKTDQKSIPETKKQMELFTLLSSSETGIDFRNIVNESDENNYFSNQYIYNGGGVGIGDINNDGLPDIYLTGNHTEDKLYLNKGNLKFEDITEVAGINSDNDVWSTGVSMVDIDSDGWLDIYVCKSGYGTKPEESENKFYLNKGDGTFREMGRILGLNDPAFSTQASFFDYDRDGDLDVYIMNYPGDWVDKSKEYVYLQEKGETIPFRVRDHLYRNDGMGKFTDVGLEAGINNLGFGLGIVTADFNDDGWVDIYVGNDYVEPDYLYINQGDGTFKESVKDYFNHLSQSSMGLDYSDFNNDGYNDLFVAEMLPSDFKRSKTNMASMNVEAFYHFIDAGKHYQYMHNVFQMNTGNNFFSDIAQITETDKTDWSWSPLLADFDQDMDKDLFVSNGIKREMLNKDANNYRKKLKKEGKKMPLDELYNMIPSTKLKNRLFINNGDISFTDKSDETGIGIHSFSNGAISADLDNDGDPDIVCNNIDESAFVYRNNSNSENYISVNLDYSATQNRNAVNASVYAYQNGVMQRSDVLTVRGYQSCTESRIHFAFENSTKVDSLIIVWPNNMIQWEYNLDLGKEYIISYTATTEAKRQQKQKLFKEITKESGINFIHRENDFNDFEDEILLPHRQSMLGPFISVADVNSDGLEDFFVGGASGQKCAIYHQNEDHTFSEALIKLMDVDAENMGSCFFDLNGDDHLDLYVVNGGNENKNSNLLNDRIYLNSGNGNFTPHKIMDDMASGSCAVSFDFDNDGDDDIFVGGRAVPGAYPMADKSMILRNENGELNNVTQELCPELERIGIITAALSTDFNNDGKTDLVVTGEWMSVLFFENTGNGFNRVDVGINDQNLTGWYYCLAESDINNDGVKDIIAGNIGLNHKFRPNTENPFYIYMDDFDSNGTNDIVLAQYDDQYDGYFPVRGKQCLSEQMPFISEEKFDSYEDFSEATVHDIFSEELEDPRVKYEARNFASVALIKKEEGYEVHELPRLAQISAVNAIISSDFDLDGEDDLLLAGNLFETEVETARVDQGVGTLVSKGQAVLDSGFFVPGDVKDIKLLKGGDSNFVIVSNNNGPVQIFKVLESGLALP